MIDKIAGPSGDGTKLTRANWRAIILASLGGALDYFDFVVYAIFARYIGAAFFPTTNPLTSILLTFLVFAVGMLARPFGGMVLSHFGDRYGRRGVFIFSILAMSTATVAIGILPTYASWGIGSTFLLVALRLIQGISVGGEMPCAQAYVMETVPRRASLVSGIVQTCVSTGILLATLINVGVTSSLTPEDVGAWGWRIPFIVGGLLGFLGFYLRRSLQESPEFENMKRHAARAPLKELFTDYRRPLLAGIGMSLVVASYNGMLFAYMPVYLTNVLKYAPLEVAKAQNLALFVCTLSVLASAWAGDRIPRHWLYRTGAVLILIFAFPFYTALVDKKIDLMLLLAMAGAAGGFANGVWACLMADLFPTRVRFSGSALCTNVSTGFVSGLAPLITTWVLQQTGVLTAPAYYLIVCCGIALVVTFFLPRYLGNIMGTSPAKPLAERAPRAVPARAGR